MAEDIVQSGRCWLDAFGCIFFLIALPLLVVKGKVFSRMIAAIDRNSNGCKSRLLGEKTVCEDWEVGRPVFEFRVRLSDRV